MRWLKRGLVLLLGLSIAAAIAYALWPKRVPVDVTTVQRGAFRVSLDEDGRTRVERRELITAPVAGELARVGLRPGDPVTRGQPVAQLSSLAPQLLDARTRAQATSSARAAEDAQTQARAAVTLAERARAFAQGELERAQRLGEQGALNQQALDAARLELHSRTEALAAARAAVDVAGHQLEGARALLGAGGAAAVLPVLAPLDGVVLRVLREDAGAVPAGTPLLEVGAPDSLEILVDVLSADAVAVSPGASAWIDGWGGPGTLAARVERVEPAAFTRLSALGVEEQRVNLHLSLTDPAERWRGLGDGFRVDAHIVTWQGDDVVSVASSALFRHGDDWAVFVIEDGRARRRLVVPGHAAALSTEIVSGLGAGQRVIAHPGERVRDGVRVTARGL
ncbi:MAG: HlyD family efflux transporter periplasmic adaptor subunit [Deltaproteobacteria bacterium]|nr:HlyD family efflux transporter periplasmic adaptor subunit [Deltaproteobacteria bacterium]